VVLIRSLWCNYTTKLMWLPTRSSTVPSHAVHGYSINQVTGDRFPAAGQFAEYVFDGYQSLYEALDTTGDSDSTDILTLDFGLKTKSTWGSFNGCQHYKRNVSIVDSVFAFFSRESGVKWRNYNIPVLSFWNDNYCNLNTEPYRAFGPADNPILGLPVLWFGLIGGVYKDDHFLWSTACENMLPGIRPSVSLINDVYELKDIKTIPKTLAAINKALTHLESLFKEGGEVLNLLKNVNRAGKRSLKSILNAGADSYLQTNFNVLPLLRDIEAVFNSVHNVKSKLKQLADHERQERSTHWGANLPGFDSFTDTLHLTGRPSDEDADVSITRAVTYASARFQATIEYSYRMPDGSYKELLVRGVEDYLGLNFSVQTVWNAIPWSFVIDWLVAVGPWLGQFTMRQLVIVTHISRSGWSVKIDRDISLTSSLTGQVGSVREKSYYRTPQNPNLISSLRTSGLNPKEFSLAAALGITSKH